MKRLLIALLAVSVGSCALPVASMYAMKGNWKGPIISPMGHVSCRPVPVGTYRNSGCVA
jgi:hypothetical protein